MTQIASTLDRPKITIIEPIKARKANEQSDKQVKKRVAAYARVSTEQDEQQNSYEAQLKYYATYIQANPDWEFVKVYADEGISGTSLKHRDEFNQMVTDAKAGKIDLILAKSISRFSRNTVDTLTVTRELKKSGVEVRFEKENLSSFDTSAELVFTMFSSIAQEESRSISENVRWGHQRRMEQGKTHVAFSRFLGYEKGENDKWIINEKESAIVREIYDLFLSGRTIRSIAQYLTDKGIKTPGGKTVWGTQTVNSILQNEKYKGDALLQKTFTVDFLTKEIRKNNGELKQIYVKNHHPAIIEPERFDLVQVELKRRSKHRCQISNNSPFTTKIICGDCGTFYGHKVHHGKDVWYCNHKYKNTEKCGSPMFHAEELEAKFAQALGQVIAQIRAGKGPKSPSKAEETKQLRLLKKAREEAANALETELIDFQKRYEALPEEEYDAGLNHITELKFALREAEDNLIAHTAQKEKQRRFSEATNELDENSIQYSDELFTATVEIVNVRKTDDGEYMLEFTFTNGQKKEVQ